MLEKIESRKLNRARPLKEQQIRSLNIASEKITSESTNYDPPPGTETEELPSWLRIESSEIELLKELGSGASAQVHKCRWLDRYYAVKVFRAGDVRNLRREVQHLLHLRHPNVVLLLGFAIGESDQRPMVVMELLDCDLHMLILRERDIPIRTAVDFIYQIATGMAYLHKKSLFHGDLKAMNVLVKLHSNKYELKISDFGVSVAVERPRDFVGTNSDCTSLSTKNVGTTRWRAPEVFDTEREEVQKLYSMKADVYSFAMICVEILTGEVPYHNIPTCAIKKHVQAGHRPKLPPKVPEELCKLIVACWDGNPFSRPGFSDICTEMQGLKETQAGSTSGSPRPFQCCFF